jgi:hypothetical protein
MMLAMVAPLGRCSSPSTRICFERARPLGLPTILRRAARDRTLDDDGAL